MTGSTITKYYYAGTQRIAMRTNGTLNYLLGDHLGSTSLITNSAGDKTNEQRYKAWGETRYSSGTTPTKYTYTGQYSNVSDFGLMFYNARWYDPALGRFAQADTIIPQNQGLQAWDRYAYTNNNPVRYTDLSGHSVDCALGEQYCQVGKLTPMALIRLNNYERSDSLENEINDYMIAHPDYDPRKDIYRGGWAYSKFVDIRKDYWENRVRNAGCEGYCTDIAYDLMQYYDYQERFDVPMNDYSRVNWNNVLLDIAGIPLGVIGMADDLRFGQTGLKILTTTGLVDSGASFISAGEQDDPFGQFLAGVSVFPVIGSLASAMSLGRDISQATYWVEYIPPIPRNPSHGR